MSRTREIISAIGASATMAAMTAAAGQVTLAGYGNMTGVGTPNGPDFIKALRKLG